MHKITAQFVAQAAAVSLMLLAERIFPGNVILQASDRDIQMYGSDLR